MPSIILKHPSNIKNISNKKTFNNPQTSFKYHCGKISNKKTLNHPKTSFINICRYTGTCCQMSNFKNLVKHILMNLPVTIGKFENFYRNFLNLVKAQPYKLQVAPANSLLNWHSSISDQNVRELTLIRRENEVPVLNLLWSISSTFLTCIFCTNAFECALHGFSLVTCN